MSLQRYAMKPMCDGGSAALASRIISPWAGFGAVRVLVRHTGNGVVRPKGPTERSTV